MSWQVLRPQIVALVDTLSTLEEVSPTPKIRFAGYPAAHVVPSQNAADFETSSENERQYAFIVRVFAETKSQGVEQAYISLEQVVDEVIDLFDEEDLKGGNQRTIGVNLPAKYTYLNIFAVPSTWQDLGDEALIFSEITVKVRISVDVSS